MIVSGFTLCEYGKIFFSGFTFIFKYYGKEWANIYNYKIKFKFNINFFFLY